MQAKLDRRPFGGLRPVVLSALAYVVFLFALAILQPLLSSVMGLSPPALWVLGLAVVAVPLGLVAWAVWDVCRRRWSAAIAIALVGLSLWGMFAASEPLSQAGNRIAFALNRPVYDRLVAEWRAGELSGKRSSAGEVEGRRYGVRYTFTEGQSESLRFKWVDGGTLWTGVEVHERPCPRRTPGLLPCSHGSHLDGPYYYFMWIS